MGEDTDKIRAIVVPFARRTVRRARLLEDLPYIIAEHGETWWQDAGRYRRYVSEPYHAGVWTLAEAALISYGQIERVRQGL